MIAAPLGTTTNGEPTSRSTDTPPPSGRDARGRFTKNNPGGPGNPFARQTAAFHRALCSVVSEEDIQAIALKLKEQALAGNLAAIKLLLSYVIGRPQAAANPDTLDLQEWEQLRQAPAMLEEMNRVIQSVTAEDACTIARIAQPLISQELCTQFGEELQEMNEEDEEDRQRARREASQEQTAREERAPRRDTTERPGATRQAPSPIGDIGADRFASMTPDEILEEIRSLARQQRSEAPPAGAGGREEHAAAVTNREKRSRGIGCRRYQSGPNGEDRAVRVSSADGQSLRQKRPLWTVHGTTDENSAPMLRACQCVRNERRCRTGYLAPRKRANERRKAEMRSGVFSILGLTLVLLAGPWLLSSRHAPAAVPEIEGTVTAGRRPLAGARVRIQGTTTETTTDVDGRFRLPHPGNRRITAWHEGYHIGGAAPGTAPLRIELTRLPEHDHDDYAWVDPSPGAGSGSCGSCHAQIYREWVGSGHGRSATGPHFRNLLEGTSWKNKPDVGWGLAQDFPESVGVCAACHAPALPDNDPALLDPTQLRGVAAQGVHCDFCHKVAGVGDGPLGLTHGRFNLRLLRPAPKDADGRQEQLFFGPLDDVDRGEDAFAPVHRQSRYCASCHEGTVLGVHVYSTYTEWLRSPARKEGKQCQDCHMTPTGHLRNFAPGHGGIERDPSTLANHRFFDGNQERMLRRCVRLTAEVRAEKDGVRAAVRLRVEDVGHRVPTGFIDRHLLLVVEGQDARGKKVFARTGSVLPAAAGPELAGSSGALYGRLLEDEHGQRPVPFWRSLRETDTRLTPGRVEEQVFRFPPDTTRLRVRLLYRRFWHEVARSKGWPDQDVLVQEQLVPLSP